MARYAGTVAMDLNRREVLASIAAASALLATARGREYHYNRESQ